MKKFSTLRELSVDVSGFMKSDLLYGDRFRYMKSSTGYEMNIQLLLKSDDFESESFISENLSKYHFESFMNAYHQTKDNRIALLKLWEERESFDMYVRSVFFVVLMIIYFLWVKHVFF